VEGPERAWRQPYRPGDFCMGDGHIILLHGFIKKTQKTPKADIDLAVKHMQKVT
jgi:phage-related protein